MLKRVLFLLFFLILWTSIYFYMDGEYVDTHEGIHQLIFEDYGINSTIEYAQNNSVDYRAHTVPDPNSTNKCTGTCTLAHNLNEVVGYNYSDFLTLIYFAGVLAGLMFFVFSLFKKMEDIDNTDKIIVAIMANRLR